MTTRIPLDDLTSDQLDTLYDRAEGAEAARDRLFRSRDRQAARANRYRLAWKSARARVKRAKRSQDGELRHANAMWSHALRDLHRYRTAWKSARHRAALYLQSNQKFAASLDDGHAAQLHALQYAAQAKDAVDSVRALHQPAPGGSGGLSFNSGARCQECDTSYRCNTIRTLDQAQQPTT